MVRRGISAALALKLDPATPEDDLPSTLRRLNDDDLLYLAISMAKQKAVNTEEFLAYVGVNFELLKKRRGAARKQSSPRVVPLSRRGGTSPEAQLTPLFAFGF
jgi:hypothetical protein